MKILGFELEDQRYAVPLEIVREVVRAVAIARIPGAPAIVEGVIDLRGEVVPVLDVRKRFGHPPRTLSLGDHLIVVSAGARTVSLRTDRVTWISEVQDAHVRQVADLTPGSEYVSGIARLSDGLTLIHDPETFLTRAEAEALDGSLAEAAHAEPGA
jgi:purine-binding chemotaxis protein CheW